MAQNGDLKRGSPSRWPHELTIITDEDDPHYDEKVTNKIDPVAVLDLAVTGQVQPVSVHAFTNRLIIVDGLQRTKRATVINHLNGSHAYKGDVESIKTCIKELINTDMAKRIIEECPRGLKLGITLFRGKEAEAYGAKISANEFRQDDPVQFKARKAQRMLHKWKFSHQDVAEKMNVSVATIKRWEKLDTDKAPKPRKPRGKSTRPTRKRLGDTFERVTNEKLKTVLGWVLGKVSLEDAAKAFPELAAE